MIKIIILILIIINIIMFLEKKVVKCINRQRFERFRIIRFLGKLLIKGQLFSIGLSDISAFIESKLFLEWTCPLNISTYMYNCCQFEEH